MNSFKTITLGLTLAVVASGCNLKSSPVASSGVTTSLAMTGSGQNVVVQSNFQKWFSSIIPTAHALTPPLLFDSKGASVNLNEAWVVIKEIEFEAQEVNDGSETDGDEVEFEGPYFVDLLSDVPISFGDAVLPATGIRRVKMKLHEAESLPDSVPAALQSKSIYLSGSVNGVNFTYAADDSSELEIGGSNPIVPSSSQDLLIVIRLADIFNKIDLSSISSSTDIHSGNRVDVSNPCPLIDVSAEDLYTCFRKGLESENDFGKDDDGDHDLDENDETVDD